LRQQEKVVEPIHREKPGLAQGEDEGDSGGMMDDERPVVAVDKPLVVVVAGGERSQWDHLWDEFLCRNNLLPGG
jgi:hypothetical protein